MKAILFFIIIAVSLSSCDQYRKNKAMREQWNKKSRELIKESEKSSSDYKSTIDDYNKQMKEFNNRKKK